MKKILCISIFLIFLLGCKKEVVKVAPTVNSVTSTSNVTSTTATISGNITNDGGDPITAKGVVYGTNPNPTLSDNKTTDGTGAGNFTTTISGLLPGKTYYFRPYATNSIGTSYGEQITLTTPAVLSSITTTPASGITASSVSTGGNITNDGGAAISARGVCWSTATNPTITNSKTTDGSGSGTFTSTVTGLSTNTTYYVRAYATNSIGTAYGNQITFTTTATIATVSTNTVSNITSTTASSGGNISADGGAAITSRGVCWSTSQNPTTSDSKTSDGSGTGNFNSSITGLSPNTTYYIRAYAINSVGTSYGTQSSFTTSANLPTITTATLTNITSISATGGGNVVSDGGSAVTARGVCWSTSQTPTVADFKTINGSGLGSFTSSITGLQAGVNYYVRAYATNSAGTAYGIAMSVNGFTADINNLVPQSIIDELKRLGMPVNSGVTPPNINGIYNASPLVVKATNISGDFYTPGYQIADLRVQFAQQDNSRLTLTMDYINGPESGSGFGSYIVGSGKLFTVFTKVNITNAGNPAIIVQIYSGSKETSSISNFYYAIFMIENYGKNSIFMSNGSGRVFYDKDGVTETVTSLKAARLIGSSLKSSSAQGEK